MLNAFRCIGVLFLVTGLGARGVFACDLNAPPARLVLRADIGMDGTRTNVQFLRYEHAEGYDEKMLDGFRDIAIQRITELREKPAAEGGHPGTKGRLFKVTFSCRKAE